MPRFPKTQNRKQKKKNLQSVTNYFQTSNHFNTNHPDFIVLIPLAPLFPLHSAFNEQHQSVPHLCCTCKGLTAQMVKKMPDKRLIFSTTSLYYLREEGSSCKQNQHKASVKKFLRRIMSVLNFQHFIKSINHRMILSVRPTEDRPNLIYIYKRTREKNLVEQTLFFPLSSQHLLHRSNINFLSICHVC